MRFLSLKKLRRQGRLTPKNIRAQDRLSPHSLHEVGDLSVEDRSTRIDIPRSMKDESVEGIKMFLAQELGSDIDHFDLRIMRRGKAVKLCSEHQLSFYVSSSVAPQFLLLLYDQSLLEETRKGARGFSRIFALRASRTFAGFRASRFAGFRGRENPRTG